MARISAPIDHAAIRTAWLDLPEHGLDAATLEATDVLLWWGHVRNREVPAETGRDIVRRIRSGKLSLVALHSAHWSTPFVEAMRERARGDALRPLTPAERATAVLVDAEGVVAAWERSGEDVEKIAVSPRPIPLKRVA
mgnify:CR=1 FL=1